MKRKHDNSTRNLEDVFFHTPVASANESTGSNDFIWNTTFEENSAREKENKENIRRSKAEKSRMRKKSI